MLSWKYRGWHIQFLACIQNWLDLSNVQPDPILVDESHREDGFFLLWLVIWPYGSSVNESVASGNIYYTYYILTESSEFLNLALCVVQP